MAVFKSDASHIIASEERERSGAVLENNNDEMNFDRAYQYILNSIHRDDTNTSLDLTALRRRIDWKIVPLMLCCYTVTFIDKVLLNVSERDELKD